MIDRYEKEMRRLFEEAQPPAVMTAVTVEQPGGTAAVPPLAPPAAQGAQMPVPLEPAPPAEQEQTGTLIVEVTTGRGAIPLAGVTVVIDRLDPADANGRKELIKVEETDAEGRIKPVTLPAANKELSLEPGNDSPFTTVFVSADERGFTPVHDRPVDIFTGEQSILKIDLVPKPEDLTEGTVLGW